MDYETAKNKLAEAYASIQNMQIQPTDQNINIMALVMRNMSQVFDFLDVEQSRQAVLSAELNKPKETEKKEE